MGVPPPGSCVRLHTCYTPELGVDTCPYSWGPLWLFSVCDTTHSLKDHEVLRVRVVLHSLLLSWPQEPLSAHHPTPPNVHRRADSRPDSDPA